jgi:hypothetical protein
MKWENEMKVTIEFELPEGQEIPKVEDILTLTSPDWHIEKWHISDVQCVHDWVTDDQAREVLMWMNKYHDANIGINWDFIQSVIENKLFEPNKVGA